MYSKFTPHTTTYSLGAYALFSTCVLLLLMSMAPHNCLCCSSAWWWRWW